MALQYILKLKCNPSNPALKVVFNPQYKRLFERKPNAIPPFGTGLEPHITNLNVDLDSIAEYKIPEIPPWTMGTAEFRFDLTSDKKSETDPNTFQVRYNEIKEHYFSFKPIYTDGSKDGNSVAAAAVYGTKVKKCRLPNKSSSFSAEVKAIDLALDLVEQRVPRGSEVRCLTRNPGVLGSSLTRSSGFFFVGVSLGKTLQSLA